LCSIFCNVVETSCRVILSCSLKLSIYITYPCCCPTMDANHQTYWAAKMYWFFLIWDITCLRANTITSLSFAKVTVIWTCSMVHSSR
jgi:hypothetical protein